MKIEILLDFEDYCEYYKELDILSKIDAYCNEYTDENEKNYVRSVLIAEYIDNEIK